MTSAYSIRWATDQEESVASPEEAGSLLRKLHVQARAGKGVLVAITSPSGDDLTLGVGRDTSVCSWMSALKDPPYFASSGERAHGPDLIFFYLGEWTEFPARYGIPVEDAIAAAREFVASGERPTIIEWQEV